ncbi:MAG: hypothetical protein JXQ96_00735 [Cyclobacteriaceae bacterium]
MKARGIILMVLLMAVLSTSAQKPSAWKEGIYYDSNNQPKTGMISYAYSHKPVFRFKPADSSKEIRLKADDVKAFVVEKDSFIVMHNFKLDARETASSNIPIDFVQVIESGSLMLYKHYSSVYSGGDSYSTTHGAAVAIGGTNMIETYIIRKPLSGAYWTIYSEPKRFKEQLKEVFHSDEVMLFKISQDEVSYSELPELVRNYNQANK